MSAEQLLSEGRPDEALSELKQLIRNDAANPKYRTFLFQLLAIQGDWERARTQLEVAGELDPLALAMVQTYREAIRCELLRADIFAGRRSPLVFGDPQRWLALLIEALQLTGAGDYAKAAPLREQAFDEAPATSGSIDGQAFRWIADGDSRLGPVLEAIINGSYYWVPFDRIKAIHLEPPADLRDMVWTPAYFTWANGGETVGLIPTRYPGSELSPDAQQRMARRTDWTEQAPGLYLGMGQRMLTTDIGDHALMDVRLIELAVSGDEAPAGVADNDAEPPGG